MHAPAGRVVTPARRKCPLPQHYSQFPKVKARIRDMPCWDGSLQCRRWEFGRMQHKSSTGSRPGDKFVVSRSGEAYDAAESDGQNSVGETARVGIKPRRERC